MDDAEASGRQPERRVLNIVPAGHDQPAREGGLDRRRFLGWGGRAALGVTAAIGGLVGFSPTGFAQDPIDTSDLAGELGDLAGASGCVGGTYRKVSRTCYYSCTGACSNYFSTCSNGHSRSDCYCSGNCSLATARFQAYCKCRATNNGYCCCKYC